MWNWFKNLFKKKVVPCPVLKEVKVVPRSALEIDLVVETILAHIEKYLSVSKITGIPADVIAAIHYREASLNFKTCLHNGDPLPGPTTHVPKGRGPFSSWEEAAIDSFKIERHNVPAVWDTAGKLDYCERYNGLGYRRKGIPSPYVYAGTDKYISGMYVADGKFSASKVDRRLGCAIIIKALENKIPKVV